MSFLNAWFKVRSEVNTFEEKLRASLPIIGNGLILGFAAQGFGRYSMSANGILFSIFTLFVLGSAVASFNAVLLCPSSDVPNPNSELLTSRSVWGEFWYYWQIIGGMGGTPLVLAYIWIVLFHLGSALAILLAFFAAESIILSKLNGKVTQTKALLVYAPITVIYAAIAVFPLL